MICFALIVVGIEHVVCAEFVYHDESCDVEVNAHLECCLPQSYLLSSSLLWCASHHCCSRAHHMQNHKEMTWVQDEDGDGDGDGADAPSRGQTISIGWVCELHRLCVLCPLSVCVCRYAASPVLSSLATWHPLIGPTSLSTPSCSPPLSPRNWQAPIPSAPPSPTH